MKIGKFSEMSSKRRKSNKRKIQEDTRGNSALSSTENEKKHVHTSPTKRKKHCVRFNTKELSSNIRKKLSDEEVSENYKDISQDYSMDLNVSTENEENCNTTLNNYKETSPKQNISNTLSLLINHCKKNYTVNEESSRNSFTDDSPVCKKKIKHIVEHNSVKKRKKTKRCTNKNNVENEIDQGGEFFEKESLKNDQKNSDRDHDDFVDNHTKNDFTLAEKSPKKRKKSSRKKTISDQDDFDHDHDDHTQNELIFSQKSTKKKKKLPKNDTESDHENSKDDHHDHTHKSTKEKKNLPRKNTKSNSHDDHINTGDDHENYVDDHDDNFINKFKFSKNSINISENSYRKYTKCNSEDDHENYVDDHDDHTKNTLKISKNSINKTVKLYRKDTNCNSEDDHENYVDDHDNNSKNKFKISKDSNNKTIKTHEKDTKSNSQDNHDNSIDDHDDHLKNKSIFSKNLKKKTKKTPKNESNSHSEDDHENSKDDHDDHTKNKLKISKNSKDQKISEDDQKQNNSIFSQKSTKTKKKKLKQETRNYNGNSEGDQKCCDDDYEISVDNKIIKNDHISTEDDQKNSKDDQKQNNSKFPKKSKKYKEKSLKNNHVSYKNNQIIPDDDQNQNNSNISEKFAKKTKKSNKSDHKTSENDQNRCSSPKKETENDEYCSKYDQKIYENDLEFSEDDHVQNISKYPPKNTNDKKESPKKEAESDLENFDDDNMDNFDDSEFRLYISNSPDSSKSDETSKKTPNSDSKGLDSLLNNEIELGDFLNESDDSTDLEDFVDMHEKPPVNKKKLKNDDFCELPISYEDTLKLKELDIIIDFEVPKLHSLLTRCTGIPKYQRDIIDKENIPFKSGKFSKEEDETIKTNWYKFIKIYGLEDKPEIFFSFRNKNVGILLNDNQKKHFVYHLSRNLPDRAPTSVYTRFKRIFMEKKKGRFDEKENQVILDYLKTSKSATPYVDLARILNRTSFAVEKRVKLLQKGFDAKIKWDRKMISKFLKHLLQITNSSDLEQLKAKEITSEQFQKLSEKLGGIPVKRLRRAWKVAIYPKIFVEKNLNMCNVKKKLVESMIKNGENDWRTVDWQSYAEDFVGMTGEKLYIVFKTLASYYVPETKTHSLKAVLTCLSKILDDSFEFGNKQTLTKMEIALDELV